MSELIDRDALRARLHAEPPPTIIDVRDLAWAAAGHAVARDGVADRGKGDDGRE